VRAAPLGQIADQRIAEPVIAGVVVVEDAEDVEQRRLARARRSMIATNSPSATSSSMSRRRGGCGFRLGILVDLVESKHASQASASSRSSQRETRCDMLRRARVSRCIENRRAMRWGLPLTRRALRRAQRSRGAIRACVGGVDLACRRLIAAIEARDRRDRERLVFTRLPRDGRASRARRTLALPANTRIVIGATGRPQLGREHDAAR